MKATPAVARSYAKALFELAREREATDAVAEDLTAAGEVLAQEPALAASLARPWIPAAAKRAAAVELASRLDLSPLSRDFLALLAANGRADHLAAVLAAYRVLADEAARRVRARVRTAAALDEEQRGALARRLGATLGGREVVLEDVVDGGLLGGFVAEVAGVLIDGSLDGQLARIRQRLARG